MIPLIGQKDVLVFKDPVAKNAKTYRWWAERGLLRWEEQESGNYGTITVKDGLLRLKAIADMIKNSRSQHGYLLPDAICEYQRYVDGMIELLKRAQSQGMPDNPEHTKQLAADIKAKRQSRMVTMPRVADMMV